MIRVICAVAGVIALTAPVRPDVDATIFAQAFRAGNADQFKNMQVSGTGVSFHGAVTERLADGASRTSLVVTLGAQASDAPITVLKTWEEFVAAERAGTTLTIALSGPNLPAVPAQPVTLTFSGVYDGQVRTIVRTPSAGGDPARPGTPCPGEQPTSGTSPGAFRCVPLLTGAKARIEE